MIRNATSVVVIIVTANMLRISVVTFIVSGITVNIAGLLCILPPVHKIIVVLSKRMETAHGLLISFLNSLHSQGQILTEAILFSKYLVKLDKLGFCIILLCVCILPIISCYITDYPLCTKSTVYVSPDFSMFLLIFMITTFKKDYVF